MSEKDSRLKKIKRELAPPDPTAIFRIVWIDAENKTYTIDGVTMTEAEYKEYKRLNPTPVYNGPEGEEAPVRDTRIPTTCPRHIDYREALKGHPIPPYDDKKQ